MQWHGRVLAALAVALAGTASGEIVELDLDAPGDGLITRDSETGLDWLDPSETLGFTYLEIELGAGGWTDVGFRHATGSEVCQLFSNGAFAPPPCPRSSSYGCEIQPGNVAEELAGLLYGGLDPIAGTALYDDETPGPYHGSAILFFDADRDESYSCVFDDHPIGSSHLLVRPATPLVDVSGSWQLNSECSSGAGGEVGGTSSFAFAEDVLTGTTTSTVSGADCGSLLVNGEIRELASCSQLPDPATGRLRSGRLEIPPEDPSYEYFNYDVTFAQPFPFGALAPACDDPPVERFIVQSHLSATNISDDGSGTATQLNGDTQFAFLWAYNTLGELCFAGDLGFFSCTWTALPNAVSAGPGQMVEPLPGATVTFTNVGSPGLVSVTRLTESDGQIPANFKLADGLYYDVSTTAGSLTPPIEVCLPYADADHDGYVDDTVPPVHESTLELGHDAVGGGVFAVVTTSRDPVNDQVCGEVMSLSQFTLLSSGLAAVPMFSAPGLALLSLVLLALGLAALHGRGRQRARVVPPGGGRAD